MSDPVTEKVWYRSHGSEKGMDLADKVTGLEDRGTLTIDGGEMSYQGKKDLVSGRVLAVEDKMLFNGIGMSRNAQRWVAVGYEADGQSMEAYFRPNNPFKGHKRLKQALEAAVQA